MKLKYWPMLVCLITLSGQAQAWYLNGEECDRDKKFSYEFRDQGKPMYKDTSQGRTCEVMAMNRYIKIYNFYAWNVWNGVKSGCFDYNNKDYDQKIVYRVYVNDHFANRESYDYFEMEKLCSPKSTQDHKLSVFTEEYARMKCGGLTPKQCREQFAGEQRPQLKVSPNVQQASFQKPRIESNATN